MKNLETATKTQPVVLKDGRRVGIRLYRPADKEGLISMYAGLSQEALRWSMPPYNSQRIERWISNMENTITLSRMMRIELWDIYRYPSVPAQDFEKWATYSSTSTKSIRMSD